ncbi:unnamed protein product [Musa hybrid cultivar]
MHQLLLSEYLGGAVNCYAYHMTDPRADGLGVSSSIRKVLKMLGWHQKRSMSVYICGSPHALDCPLHC